MDYLLQQLVFFPEYPPPTPLSDAEYHKKIKSLLHLLNSTPASKLTSIVSDGSDILDVSCRVSNHCLR